MRLAIVNPYQHGGGAEFQIDCLARVLRQGGRFDISYLARFVKSEAGTDDPYDVIRVGDGGAVSRLGYLADALPLWKALTRLAPDVIYQRVACGYTGICAHYARRHAIPMVWHVAHDSDVLPGAHTSGRNPLRRKLEKLAIEYGLRHSRSIVVQTQRQAQLLRQHYGRDPAAVIANFHPPATEAQDKSGPRTVVWVANLKPMKQPEAFVRLARALADLQDVRFIMVGAYQATGTELAWGEEVMASMRETPNLEYLGQRTQAEVNALLARSLVFVNTSLQEGFPNTFIQSWLRGAAVCSLHVDPDGVLARERLGLFAGDEQRLQDGVRMLLQQPAVRDDYARRGLDHALEHHSLRNAERLGELLTVRS